MVREMDFVDECYADKDLSLLKKLTLVIPTYNRNYYLSRCLWYHAHFPFGQIIVADSSPEEKKVVNRETVAKIREMFGANILYLEYEPETEKYGGDIYRKWGDAVMHVETEYSQICTDKEFVIPTTQCLCLDFLGKNSDYGVASGKYFAVERCLKKTIIRKRYPSRSPICDESGLMRYQSNFLVGDNAHLLSLYRSKYHKKIYAQLLLNRDFDLRFGERYLEYTIYLYAKAYYTNIYPFNIRDLTQLYTSKNKINLAESSSMRYPKHDSYDKKSEEVKKMYLAYKDAIVNTLVGLDVMNRDSADIYFTTHVKEKICQHKYLPSSRKIYYKIGKWMSKYAPGTINTIYSLTQMEIKIACELSVILKIIRINNF